MISRPGTGRDDLTNRIICLCTNATPARSGAAICFVTFAHGSDRFPHGSDLSHGKDRGLFSTAPFRGEEGTVSANSAAPTHTSLRLCHNASAITGGTINVTFICEPVDALCF